MDEELEKQILSLDDNAKIILKASLFIMLARIKEVEKYYLEVIDKLKLQGDKKE